jgi:hypothetical protein
MKGDQLAVDEEDAVPIPIVPTYIIAIAQEYFHAYSSGTYYLLFPVNLI